MGEVRFAEPGEAVVDALEVAAAAALGLAALGLAVWLAGRN